MSKLNDFILKMRQNKRHIATLVGAGVFQILAASNAMAFDLTSGAHNRATAHVVNSLPEAYQMNERLDTILGNTGAISRLAGRLERDQFIIPQERWATVANNVKIVFNEALLSDVPHNSLGPYDLADVKGESHRVDAELAEMISLLNEKKDLLRGALKLTGELSNAIRYGDTHTVNVVAAQLDDLAQSVDLMLHEDIGAANVGDAYVLK